jgi:pantetheine-phosphate adenylyltransferase
VTNKLRVGLYPGTFDPITSGHSDIILRASRVVDHLVIGVATNAGKGPLFSVEERVAMVAEEAVALNGNGAAASRIEVKPFDNLLMQFAVENGASVIIRGLRAVTDFEYEFQMAGMNAALNPAVETLFLMASGDQQFVSSRLVKEVGRLGGDISRFVSPRVAQHMKARFDEERAANSVKTRQTPPFA